MLDRWQLVGYRERVTVIRSGLRTVNAQPETISAISWSPNSRHLALACASPRHGVVLIEHASLSENRRFPGATVVAEEYGAEGAFIAVVQGDDAVCIIDVDDGGRRPLGQMSRACAIGVSPDAKAVAASSMHGEISVWSLTNYGYSRIREGSGEIDDAIYCLSFSPDGRLLVAGHRSGRILRWRVPGYESLEPLVGHEDIVMSLVFSRDRRYLASGAFDASVRLWDASTGDHLDTLRAPGRPGDSVVPAVSFSPDSRLLASAHPFQTTLLWDVHTRQVARRIDGYSVGSVISTGHMAFSPDGSTLAVSTGEHRVFFYDVGTEVTRQIALSVDE